MKFDGVWWVVGRVLFLSMMCIREVGLLLVIIGLLVRVGKICV